jgi:ribosome-associated protein
MDKEKAREVTKASIRHKSGMITEWLREKQAEDVLSLDVGEINSCTEAMVIVSAQNMRHAQALADWALAKFSENGMEVLGVEGYQPGSWILLDGNDVVLHIFQTEYRAFYNLDGLWREAPRLEDDRAGESES